MSSGELSFGVLEHPGFVSYVGPWFYAFPFFCLYYITLDASSRRIICEKAWDKKCVVILSAGRFWQLRNWDDNLVWGICYVWAGIDGMKNVSVLAGVLGICFFHLGTTDIWHVYIPFSTQKLYLPETLRSS